MKKKFTIEIFKESCKGCEICVHFCPVDILYIGEDRKVAVTDEDKCVGCLVCEYRCPDFAIAAHPAEEMVKA